SSTESCNGGGEARHAPTSNSATSCPHRRLSIAICICDDGDFILSFPFMSNRGAISDFLFFTEPGFIKIPMRWLSHQAMILSMVIWNLQRSFTVKTGRAQCLVQIFFAHSGGCAKMPSRSAGIIKSSRLKVRFRTFFILSSRGLPPHNDYCCQQ